MTALERKERMKERQNAMQTALAGLLIAHGNGVVTAELKAGNAMRSDWQRVRSELERWGWNYKDMRFKD